MAGGVMPQTRGGHIAAALRHCDRQPRQLMSVRDGARCGSVPLTGR